MANVYKVFIFLIITARISIMMTFFIILLLCLIFIPEFIVELPGRTRTYSAGESEQRRAALREASIYLAPYKNIWRDLRLSNKYCSLILEHDGVTIRCIEKVKPYRKLQVIRTPIHTHRELWNMFCIYFAHNKSYNGVKEDCQRYGASIIETIGMTENEEKIPTEKNTNTPNVGNNINESNEKTDVNNCSEIELTELPGISIVIAKKIIKKREEIGGFKTVEEFLNYIKLKPHMENQLRTRIKTEKMKGSIFQKKYNERSVDL